MAHEYGFFHCRVCGEKGFAPLPAADGKNGDSTSSNGFELTCSKGHTDSYDLTKIQKFGSQSEPTLKARRAYAAVG